MREIFIVGSICTVVVGAPLSAIAGLAMWLDSASCHSTARAMGIPSTWGPLQGCIVEYRGIRMPISAVGVRSVEILKDH